MRRAVGKWALAAATVPEPERRAVIESRLPSHACPVRALKIVAVDAESGEPRIFGSESGVSLVDAVTASCAMPGVWRTEAVEGLRLGGAEVAIVEPDEASLAAIGANPLDPSTRKPAAEAGRAQGRGLEIEWNRV